MSTTVEEAVRARPARARLDIARFRDLSLIPFILLLLVVGFIVSPNFLTTTNMSTCCSSRPS